MPARHWADLTWEDLRKADGSRSVAVLPVGAVEAHGPHLPLSTDVIIADVMARAGSDRLAEQGYEAWILPPLVYSAAPFARGFAGSLSVDPDHTLAIILDIARALTRQGFQALALANAHLDPTHLRCLTESVARARSEGLVPIIFPDLTRKPWAAMLTDEFRSGACHAGRYETSIVLAARPDLVRDEVRLGLEPNPASLSEAIQRGKRTFEEAGGPRAYFGWPADATAAEGRATIATLGSILAEAVSSSLGAETST